MTNATPTTLKVGDRVLYREFGEVLPYTVTEVTNTGRVRLNDGLGDLEYSVPESVVTLIESAPTTTESTPIIIQPNTTPAPTARPLLVKRPTAPRTSRQMSTTAANTIADLGCSALIGRGRGHGQLDVRQILALHDRGYLIARVSQETGRIVDAVITGKGVGRAAEVISAELNAELHTSFAPVLAAA